MPKPPPAATARIPHHNSPKVAAALSPVHQTSEPLDSVALGQAQLELYRLAHRIILSARELGYNAATDKHSATVLREVTTIRELLMVELQTKGN